jgi:hypothetical protein
MPFTQSGLPFARGSHTSHKAAVSAGRTRGAKVAALMALYRAAGPPGLTDPEASRALSKACDCIVPVQSICSLRNALVEDGIIGKAGERVGDFGKAVTVWFWLGYTVGASDVNADLR